MRQKAVVVETGASVATVEVLRSSMCEGCEKSREGGSCACGELLGAGRVLRAAARNDLGASVGDRVEVETASQTVLGYAALVFLLPVLAALVFYLAAQAVFASEAAALIAAGVGFVLSFIPILIVDRSRRGRPQLTVVSVLRTADDGEEGVSEE